MDLFPKNITGYFTVKNAVKLALVAGTILAIAEAVKSMSVEAAEQDLSEADPCQIYCQDEFYDPLYEMKTLGSDGIKQKYGEKAFDFLYVYGKDFVADSAKSFQKIAFNILQYCSDQTCKMDVDERACFGNVTDTELHNFGMYSTMTTLVSDWRKQCKI